jgi:hypothetical protein
LEVSPLLTTIQVFNCVMAAAEDIDEEQGGGSKPGDHEVDPNDDDLGVTLVDLSIEDARDEEEAASASTAVTSSADDNDDNNSIIILLSPLRVFRPHPAPGLLVARHQDNSATWCFPVPHRPFSATFCRSRKWLRRRSLSTARTTNALCAKV